MLYYPGKSILVALLTLTFTSAAFSASSYQSTFSYSFVGEQHASLSTSNKRIIGLSYNLSPVDLTNKPLMEAEFLARSPSIKARYGLSGSKGINLAGDESSNQLKYTYMHKDSMLMLEFSQGNSEINEINSTLLPVTRKNILRSFSSTGFGLFFSNTLLAVKHRESDNLTTENTGTGGLNQSSHTMRDNTLMLKSVFQLDNNSWLNIELAGTKKVRREGSIPLKFNRTINVAVDYHINPHFSIGANLEETSGDQITYNGERSEIRTNVFFTKKSFVKASFVKFTSSSGTNDYEQVHLSAGLRF